MPDAIVAATDARATPPSAQPALQLAIVVPTYNEADNVLVLADRLHDLLDPICTWEMIVVDDDSRDGTADLVEDAARAGDTLRCIRRIGRRGLSTAVIEGCLATCAPLIVVMDADLQHDEAVIPRMLDRLADPDCNLVVATRYGQGGSTGDWNRTRKTGSTVATRLAKLVTSVAISDPMSGFFAMRRALFLQAAPHLSGAGFKILLDIAASATPPPRVAEVPYTFRLRTAGESKLSTTVVFDYLGMIIEKRSGGVIPARFALFACTGTLGVAVHMLTLYLLNQIVNVGFDWAQVGAVMVSMTFNFVVNNTVTYADRRLRHGAAWLGLLRFYLVCGTGALSNVGVANFVFTHGSGWFASGLAGAFVASVFNFAMSNRYVWSKRR